MWYPIDERPDVNPGGHLSCDVLGRFENGKMIVVYYDTTEPEPTAWKDAEQGLTLDGANKLTHWCMLPKF
jgi:hypothetical protein